jgi:hypothetical protein
MQTVSFDPGTALAVLPDQPHESLTDKYMFLDTRKVVGDMRDLGFEVTGFRRPRTRTANGLFGLHEVQFQKPDHAAVNGAEGPRIVFMNSYDGSRRAQFAAGLIRYICLNGMIIGADDQMRFLHLGNYEEELMAQMKAMAEKLDRTFGDLERHRQVTLDEDVYLDMAAKAVELRFPAGDDRPEVDPSMFLLPRRMGDVGEDLWTRWNVLQENIMRGGVPVVSAASGEVRLSQPVNNIVRSHEINRGLWGILDTFAEAA